MRFLILCIIVINIHEVPSHSGHCDRHRVVSCNVETTFLFDRWVSIILRIIFFFSRLNYSVKKESGVKAAESCVPLVPRLLLSLLSGYSLQSACCATCLHKPLPQPAAPFLCSGAWQTPGRSQFLLSVLVVLSSGAPLTFGDDYH